MSKPHENPQPARLPGQSQPNHNKPSAMAHLADTVAKLHARLTHPSGGKSPAPREPARSGPSTVSQAKNYLRATRPPKFLNPNRSLERHARKCAICHHPEREMIEELFVHWHSPQSIVDFLADYDNVNWVSIYRHAYALGLDAVRRRNLGFVFENILDNAADATPTAAGVIAAARAISCINSEGRWVEPPKRILMTTLVRKEPASATASTEPNSSAASTDTVPPPQEEGMRVHAAHVGADYDRPESSMRHPTVRSGTREIRLPLNSHQTKNKPIPNR